MNGKMEPKTHGYLLRGVVVLCVIIIAESVHGTLRELWLKPLVGDFRARQIAFFSGMALILAITWIFVSWLRAEGKQQLLQIGFIWLVLTAAFEFALGVFVLGYSWERMFEDYNLLRGGLMGLGLLWLMFAPLLAAHWRASLDSFHVRANKREPYRERAT